MATSSPAVFPAVLTWENSTYHQGILQLLSRRATVGKSLSNRGLPLDVLSSRSAWSPRRMQNMILAVGPTTPASVIGSGLSSNHSSLDTSDESNNSNSSCSDDDSMRDNNVNEDYDGDTDAHFSASSDIEDDDRPIGRSRWLLESTGDNEGSELGDSESERMEDDGVEASFSHFGSAEQELSGDDDIHAIDEHPSSIDKFHGRMQVMPSMRHNGCINTAAWIDCGWRLSTTSIDTTSGILTCETPTQVVTSGDDLMIKVWDMKDAMGISSPLVGSSATVCPFSAPDSLYTKGVLRSKWKRYYAENDSSIPAGCVGLLASVSTGHVNNIFNVTPVKGQPGKMASCAADGFLKLVDMEANHSRTIISPEYEDPVQIGISPYRPAMCFSHHFLTQNTGLLCSEQGLRRFDLRLPPREQAATGMLMGSGKGCKACAVFSSSSSLASDEISESAYVLAGGSTPEVALWDLRMTGAENSCKEVRKYCPRALSSFDMVAVSGIDLSRDKEELLVSYESDQIYTFPLNPICTSRAGLTIDELENRNGNKEAIEELACYGGHLNRYTFLKNAKYAGPRDEYICTGSDSGRAWIYNKADGSVVSLLNADSAICNGVIPHQSLPLFVTYGIDSTAKLWRATLPIDPCVDDSKIGRRTCHSLKKFKNTTMSTEWEGVKAYLLKLNRKVFKEDIQEKLGYVLPDQILSGKEMRHRGRSCDFSPFHQEGTIEIGNDLRSLPEILTKNYFESIKGVINDNAPVESGPKQLKHRISLMRLRHQAHSLGLLFDKKNPWKLNLSQTDLSDLDHLHRAALVPDFPSDWIPYDPKITSSPWDFKNYFNWEHHIDFFNEHYLEPGKRIDHGCKVDRTENTPAPSSADSNSRDKNLHVNEQKHPLKNFEEILLDIILLLKDAGNMALHTGNLDLAAWQYEKALRYAAVANMDFPVSSLDISSILPAEGSRLKWKVVRPLVITRLNFALVLNKPYFKKNLEAAQQAQLALNEIDPFCKEESDVDKYDECQRNKTDMERLNDALKLQAKAYFRLGSAQYDLNEFSEAISAFEKSLKISQANSEKADKLLMKKLSDARRARSQARKRYREKFEFGFATGTNDEDKKGA